jgi:hypothetical protein
MDPTLEIVERLVKYTREKRRRWNEIVESTRCYPKAYWENYLRSMKTMVSSRLGSPFSFLYDEVREAHEYGCPKCRNEIQDALRELYGKRET